MERGGGEEERDESTTVYSGMLGTDVKVLSHSATRHVLTAVQVQNYKGNQDLSNDLGQQSGKDGHDVRL